MSAVTTMRRLRWAEQNGTFSLREFQDAWLVNDPAAAREFLDTAVSYEFLTISPKRAGVRNNAFLYEWAKK